MNPKNIKDIRLQNQQIASSKFKNARDLVKWMGALQAQDYPMSKWAVGIRIPGFTTEKVEAALNKGDIIRTHLMRPTWHLVAADDIYWMLELTRPRILTTLRSRHKQLGITDDLLKKNRKILQKYFKWEKYAMRATLVKEYEKENILNNNNLISHLLLCAELDGLICSGPEMDNKPTYTLLENRVPYRLTNKKEESLALLATRYFQSHSPATLEDFTWWAGLSTGEAKTALEMIKTNLISETINHQTYWLSDQELTIEKAEKHIYLLPAYDEYIISYKYREQFISSKNQSKAISSNGMFWPVIVIDGLVSGLWKRTIKNNSVKIETDHFRSLNNSELRNLENAVVSYGRFVGKIPVLQIK